MAANDAVRGRPERVWKAAAGYRSRSRLSVWVDAVRPKTLAAGAVPVAVAVALAQRSQAVDWTAAAVCLLFALLVQVGTNLSNDHQDFVRGADTIDRRGPTRLVAGGWVHPQSMARAALGVFCAAFVVGMFLIPLRGWELLPIGLACIAAGYAYTGGPRPLAYHALGDVFVIVCFGLVAVGATHYVLVGTVGVPALLAGACVGLVANSLLVVNNTRDIETDAPAGKRTLAVVIGEAACRTQFSAQLVLAFVLLAPLAYLTSAWGALAPLLCAPFALALADAFKRATDGPNFNRCLGRSAGLLLVFGTLLTIGLFVS